MSPKFLGSVCNSRFLSRKGDLSGRSSSQVSGRKDGRLGCGDPAGRSHAQDSVRGPRGSRLFIALHLLPPSQTRLMVNTMLRLPGTEVLRNRLPGDSPSWPDSDPLFSRHRPLGVRIGDLPYTLTRQAYASSDLHERHQLWDTSLSLFSHGQLVSPIILHKCNILASVFSTTAKRPRPKRLQRTGQGLGASHPAYTGGAIPMTDRTDTVHISTITTTESTVLESFPAGAPRGSWPAEEFAAARRAEGIPATVVMNITTDTFDVKAVNA